MDDAVKCRWIAAHILPHEADVRGWLVRHVRTLSGADADDLIQEAYARLWSSDLPAVENGRAYFFTVVRNLVLEQARRARIVPMERMGEIESLRIVSEEPGPERRVSARQELERLRRIIEQLPAQCRRTFELRKFDGLSIRETAQAMGITESTVEKHLTRALALILDAISDGSDETDAATAIHEFGSQSGVQILASAEALSGKRLNNVSGELSTDDGLKKLLADTGLSHQYVGERAVALVSDSPVPGSDSSRTPSAPQAFNNSETPDPGTAKKPGFWDRVRLAQNDQSSKKSDSDEQRQDKKESSGQDLPAPEETGKAIPEVLVVGSKVLNMDIRRSRDDAQPYVIFDRAAVESSGADSIEAFLKQRLTANTQASTFSQVPAQQFGSMSSINLRGLGVNQTLILVDGHRISGLNWVEASQPDINGIPLAAIERIEVLPTTASGIYGGSATGGVINIVMRRDYAGVEAKVTNENTFDTDSSISRADLNGGFSLESGKTSVLLAASYSDANVLAAQDRDFTRRGRAAIMANNPGSILNATIPPLGATSNIRSANGSDLVLDNGTPLGSPITFVPAGYGGAATDNGAALVANAGRYNLALANSAQGNGGGKQALLNNPTIESLMATVRRRFTDRVEAFLEVGASRNRGRYATSGLGSTVPRAFTLAASAPNNPFQQRIHVAVPSSVLDSESQSTSRTRRAIGGVIVKLARDWTAEADYTWSWNSVYYTYPLVLLPSTGGVKFTDGTLDILRDTNVFPLTLQPSDLTPGIRIPSSESTLKDAALRLSGPVWTLPAGPVQVTTLVERRDQQLGDVVLNYGLSSGGFSSLVPSGFQLVKSAYVEARVPLVSARNRIRGVEELELQLAGRYDDYESNGGALADSFSGDPFPPIVRTTTRLSSTDPTVALRYQPLGGFVLRASYGTGFLPPDINQLTPTGPFGAPFPVGATDPLRGGEEVIADVLVNGNPNLKPEESKSWSAGVILTPRVLPGVRLSVDYTRIEKTDNIAFHPFGAQGYVDDGFVVRAAPTPGDPFVVGPITRLDFIYLNLARADVQAWDLQLDYGLETARFGRFDFFTVATRQTHYTTQTIAGQPFVENVGVSSSNPLAFKANAGVTWKYGNWTGGWTARYFDSYRVSSDPTVMASQGNGGRVSSQTYHDLFGSYQSAQSSGLLANSEVRVGIKNVFNQEPPFDANSTLFYYSLHGDPRLASYYVTLKKGF